MSAYELMHGDIACGLITLDSWSNKVTGYKDYGLGHSPFFGTADTVKISKWWETRAVPGSRRIIQHLLQSNENINAQTYLAKNLALSITDKYWIRPLDMELDYADVKLDNLLFENEGKIPYHNATSYDPNASLGGQMEKYWDLNGSIPVLVKESYQHYGQQSLNEVFATHIHECLDAGVPYVTYTAQKKENGFICKCDAFTTGDIELISAYEVVNTYKSTNDISPFDSYIKACVSLGIPLQEIQDFMEYQAATDIVIGNSDRHLLNFGILRNAKTMKVLSPAPIFDSGNSMYYADALKCACTRKELLEKPITSIYKTEEKFLEKITGKSIVEIEKLPEKDFVLEFYTKAGVPEEKVQGIAHNYSIKIDFVREAQGGIKISLYNEKQLEQKRQKTPAPTHAPGRHKQQKSITAAKFQMVCGLPFSGKTALAKELICEASTKGVEVKGSEDLYPFADLVKNNRFFLDEEKTLKDVASNSDYSGRVTLISVNNLCKEGQEIIGDISDDYVFLMAKARIQAALISGCSVVFEATNISKSQRESYLDLVNSCSKNIIKELYVTNAPNKSKCPDVISDEQYSAIKQRFLANNPTKDTGWDKIVNK